MKRILSFLLLVFLPHTSTIATPYQSEETLPFNTIIKYDNSVLPSDAPMILIISKRREWKAIWKAAHFGFGIYRPPLPEIDFASKLIILVSREYPSRSSITKIVKTEDGLQVFMQDIREGTNCGPSGAPVFNPLQIVQTERLDKIIREKEHRLVVDVETVDCMPPR